MAQQTVRESHHENTGAVRAWLSAPLIALVGAFAVFGTLGLAGVHPFVDWPQPLRWALGVMFLLTASARLGSGRRSLVAMVPRRLPRPDLLVQLTGVLEVLGALGLAWRPVAPAAAVCLAALLLAMFPANVHAARAGVGLGERPPTPLPIRTAQQALYVACAILAAL